MNPDLPTPANSPLCADAPAAPDGGLQQERTALAWERTAISTMVLGVLLARYAASDAHRIIAGAGLIQATIGGLMLIWAGRHYRELHDPVRAGADVVHPTAARIIGLTTVVFVGVATLLAALLILD